jgi:hypothetical protein
VKRTIPIEQQHDRNVFWTVGNTTAPASIDQSSLSVRGRSP